MSRFRLKFRFLVASNIAAWSVLLTMLLSGLTREPVARFDEIQAERLTVVAANGRPAMVLASAGRLPGPSMNGKSYPPELADGRDLVSGIIFFNDDGDEVGGLIYNGFPKQNGYSAIGHLSFDQWKQNQIVALQYLDSGSSRRAGLRVWDRPTDVGLDAQLDRGLAYLHADSAARNALQEESAAARERGEDGVERLFVGSRDGVAQLQLRDADGHVRARLLVDSLDNARLEFLDEFGNVTARYPSGG